MKNRTQADAKRTDRPTATLRARESGAALLIAIFALLLISVVALAMVISSGTESALQSNYRTSTAAYYAALAGLEEARGRMLWINPDNLNLAVPQSFLDTTGQPAMPLSNVLYIINPANGETVAPTDPSNPLTYPDKQYQSEFGVPPSSATVMTIPSVSSTAGIQGPLFKWVRITGATEQSLGLDVDNSGGALAGNPSALYYDPSHTASTGQFKPGLVSALGPPTDTSRQALEITALAAIPPNTQKLLQYVVAPISYGLHFHAALVMPGSLNVPGFPAVVPNVTFQGSQDGVFQVNGIDGSGLPPAIATCTPGGSQVIGVGVTDNSGTPNVAAVTAGIRTIPLPGTAASYIGQGVTPSVQDVFVNSAMRTPASLNAMVQQIAQYADVNIAHGATQADMPVTMSQTNPQTVVINGGLTINGSYTGYGLLVVTGDLIVNGDFGWKGVVLVVGSGNVTFTGGPGGSGEIDGAFLVAHTMDTTVVPPQPLQNLGMVNFNANLAMGRGIYYNSCWINMAIRPPAYQILSFREIDPTE